MKCDACKGTGVEPIEQTTQVVLTKMRIGNGMTLRTAAARMEMSSTDLADLERGRAEWTEEFVDRFLRLVLFRQSLSQPQP